MIGEMDKIDAAKFDKHKKVVYMMIYDYGYKDCNLNEHIEFLRKKIEFFLTDGMIEHFSIKEKIIPKLKYEIQVFVPEYPPQEYLNYMTCANSEVSNVSEHEIKLTCTAP